MRMEIDAFDTGTKGMVPVRGYWGRAVFIMAFLAALLFGSLTSFAGWDDAIKIQANSDVKDNIPKAGGKIEYTFTTPEDGAVSFAFNHTYIDFSDDYWLMQLFNSEYKRIVYYRYKGNQAENLSTTFGLPAGKYYIRISSSNKFSNEGYMLRVNYQAAPDWEKEFNSSYELANPIALNSWIKGCTHSGTDNDYYTFTLQSPGKTVLSFEHEHIDFSDTYWYINLYDENYKKFAQWIVHGDEDKITTQPFGLAAGKYYIMIHSATKLSDCNYKLSLDYTSSSVWEQERNSTWDTSTEIRPGTAWSGNIMWSVDRDYYNFRLDADENLGFTFSHPDLAESGSYWTAALYDSQYHNIWKNTYKGDVPSVKSSLGILKAGKYYLTIQSANKRSDSTYQFLFSKQKEDKKTEPEIPSETVEKLPPVISAKNVVKVIGSKAFKLNAKLLEGDGVLKYSSSNTKVASVSSKGVVKIKKVGKTKITIFTAATEKYTAGKSIIMIRVVPRAVKLKKLQSTKKGRLTISWAKNKNADGYRIQYSRNKKFKNAKTVRIKGWKKGKKTVKVKSGKTYYVRIQTYKGSMRSAWSKVKKKKIK